MAQKKEIIINAKEALTRIAIVEDGELAELFLENQENERTIGNILLGRVRRIMPSIQAAFVDIGQKQDAFLHFSDLSDHLPEQLAFLEHSEPRVEHIVQKQKQEQQKSKGKGKRRRPQHGKGGSKSSDGDADDAKKQGTEKSAQNRGRRRSAQRRSQKRGRRGRRHRGELAKHLKENQCILVKITKEPISNKGSRISTDISLAGRFLVLIPFGDYVAVSKKISSYKERRRLRTLAKSLVPDGFGVIVRTVAGGRNAKALDTDLRLLLEKWHKLERKLAGKPKPPLLLHEDVNMVSSIMRDLFSDDYDRVLIDDARLHRNIKNYIQAVAPQMASAVHLHKSDEPVFQIAGISDAVAEAFESRVELPSGGYLFIEHTEAMHVIDVNSGRSGRGMSQEESSLKVNLEAARAITRQMRLRDLGGIIVVDFIDLRDSKNRKKVYDELKKEFKKDRAVTKVLPMSDFGVVQITRQRLRPSITTTFTGPNGSDKEATPDPDPKRSSKNGRRTDTQTSGRSASTRSSGKAPSKQRKEALPQKEAPQEAPGADTEAARPEPSPGKQNGQPKHRRAKRGHRQQVPAEPAPGAEELVQAMEQWITTYRAQGNRHAVTLQVHPFTAAYLNRRVPNYPTRWFIKHLVRVRMEISDMLPPTTFRFFDTRSGKDLTDEFASQNASS